MSRIIGSKLILSVLLGLALGAVGAQNNLPTRGKKFWAGFMQNGFGAQALRVHIVSTNATTGTVSMPLAGWTQNFAVAANSSTVIVVPAAAENTGSGTISNKGVLIESNDSVNVFISSFQNFTHDLSQLLPETSIGDRYRVDSYHGIPNFNNLHKSELLVVATQDGTQVKITPHVATASGQPAGIPFTVDLNAGQTYQIQAVSDALDLTGTLVEATENSGSCRPFVVFGGSMCATLPGSCSACDHIFEQILPLPAWGMRYFTAPINGVNSYTYRILANENNTSVTIGANAPIVLNAGQKHEVNGATVPVCIQANKPVSVAQLLEGVVCAGSGDPSMVILSPHDRLTQRAAFTTLISPQLSQHSIGIICPPASVGQITLDGSVISAASFQPYSNCNDRVHAKVTVAPGYHQVVGPNGFQLYMFGIGAGESYAASVNDIRAIAIPQDSTICGAGPVTLVAPVVLTGIQWTAASDPSVILDTTNTYSFTPSATDSYTVSGIQPITGCPYSFTYNVGVPLAVPSLPVANGSSSATICQYEQVQLGLVPSPDPDWFDVQWWPAESLSDPNSPAPIASPQSTTWYKVEVTSPTGCGSMLDSVLVQVSPGQILDLSTAAVPAQVCSGSSTTLSSQTLRVIASDRFNGPVAPFLTVQGGTVSNSCGSVDGNALYFNGAGQRSVQTGNLNTSTGGRIRFHLKIANGTAPCDDADPGENVILEYSTSNGFSWNAIQTFNENAYPSLAQVDLAIPAAAQNNNTMFRIRQVLHSGSGQDNWLIDDLIIARIDNLYAAYQWSPSVASPSSASTSAIPQQSGWYVLTATDPSAGCAYSDSVYVTVVPSISLQVTPDTVLCAVSGIQLNATPVPNIPVTYSWSPNGSLNNAAIADPLATPQTTTAYSVTATTAAGCTATEQVTITVGQLLDLAINASDLQICQGQQVQLNAVASGANGLQYSWSNASTLNSSTSASPIATPTQTTTYMCTVTDPVSGCSLSESITINVTTGYMANAGSDVTLCSALGHQLNVQHNVPNAIYQWSPAANLNNSNIQAPTVLADASETYTVVVTDQNGCSVTDQIVITKVYQNVPGTIAATSCADAPPILNAPANAASYSWSTGQTTSSITPAASGNYTLTMTSSQGCQAVTTFNVTLHALPIVDLGADVSLCGATDHVLNAGNAGSSFNWSTGAQSQSITVTTSGSYSVAVTNANGCSASDAVNVSFNAMPQDMLQDVTTCVSDPPVLDAGNPGCTYSWNTGAQTSSITASTSGTYSVTITTAQNCSATFDAMVQLMPLVTIDLGNDTSICEGNAIVLQAGGIDLSYEWTNQATSTSIVVNASGVYGVTASNGYCSAYDDIAITVTPAPIDVLNDVTVCEGTPVTLDAGNDGSTFQWSTGSVTSSTDVTASGNYSVVVTNASECSRTMDANVVFVAPPVVELGADTVLCEGDQLIISAAQPQCMYQWNTGATTSAIGVTLEGSYSVVVSNGYCQVNDLINIYFNPRPLPLTSVSVQACLEEEPRYVELDAENNGSQYLWSTGEVSQIIRAQATGTYTVEITNNFGCSRTASIEVIEYCPSTIFAPNTFTPNTDGLNDLFMPVGRNIEKIQFAVFDRWGIMIYYTEDLAKGWDGTYMGENVPDDTYVWKLNYRTKEENGQLSMEQEMIGHVQVLR
jgi:gliding motility-associated-like protein